MEKISECSDISDLDKLKVEIDLEVEENDETDANFFGFSKVDAKTTPSAPTQPPKPKVSKHTDNIYYDMTNTKRGVALIFNHMNFDKQSKRNGTDKDRDRIGKVLKSFNFDVRTYNDLKRDQLLDVLNGVAKEDHSNNDCLVVVVMSHGETGTLFARDREYPVENLWAYFYGNNCASLINKPKLFFIQACRGDKLDEGSVFRSSGMDSVDSSADEPITYVIPSTADLLVMYSTFEGHYAWRSPQLGSWFIQALCDELEENGRVNDLMTILVAVNRRVAYGYQSNVPNRKDMDEMKQMPSIVCMLTKILYFTRKIKETVI